MIRAQQGFALVLILAMTIAAVVAGTSFLSLMSQVRHQQQTQHNHYQRMHMSLDVETWLCQWLDRHGRTMVRPLDAPRFALIRDDLLDQGQVQVWVADVHGAPSPAMIRADAGWAARLPPGIALVVGAETNALPHAAEAQDWWLQQDLPAGVVPFPGQGEEGHIILSEWVSPHSKQQINVLTAPMAVMDRVADLVAVTAWEELLEHRAAGTSVAAPRLRRDVNTRLTLTNEAESWYAVVAFVVAGVSCRYLLHCQQQDDTVQVLERYVY